MWSLNSFPTSHEMHSVSTRSSGSFTVSTGGRHYVPVNAPLGRGMQHIKEIKPVPPTYVTEYESAFTWPPNWAYATFRTPKELRKAVLGPMPVPKWKQLQDITDKLKSIGFETELMDAAKKAATEAKLNYALEYANSRLSDAVLAADLHKEDNGSYPIEMPEETVKLCNEFTATIKAIKSC